MSKILGYLAWMKLSLARLIELGVVPIVTLTKLSKRKAMY